MPSHPSVDSELAARLDYLKARPAIAPAEAAELGGVSLSTVRRALAAVDLPHRKLGRRVLIPTAAVLAWLTGATEDGAA